MTARRIVNANFKGGVAKSTTSANTAAALALSYKRRVLLCDLDMQANSTELFIPEDHVEVDLRDVLHHEATLGEAIIHTRIPNLDLVPATFELGLLDKELVRTPKGHERVGEALTSIYDCYDYVIFDTPPGLSELTLGALSTADYYILPVSAQVWSSGGLRKFVRWITAEQGTGTINAQLLGLLATIVDRRTRIGRTVLQTVEKSSLPHFATYIPKRIGTEDAVMVGAVAGESDADPEISRAYQQLTGEIIALAERPSFIDLSTETPSLAEVTHG